MVDCGMSFAGDWFPGIDLMFPDPCFIEREKKSLLGLVVTHGHEDHIGAIPHIWSRFRCPIYATPFTASLIEDKLKEAGLEDQVELHLVADDQEFNLGPFSITYVALAHSIAEGHGLLLKTKAGNIFHTGDWKLDPTPLIGPDCPSDRLKAIGGEGVLALVGDSTNVFNPENAGSEQRVRERLIDICDEQEGRVIITTFASNVARLDTVGEVAKATGRHLVLLGRSMQRITKAARETGYLQNLPPILDEEDAAHLPRERLLICCTGCQGESRAALSRIARDDHKHLTLSEGDTVIFSSKIIPGNELVLGALFNTLSEAKVEVITEKDDFVHVSGHPGQADLEDMYAWIRPEFAIPVHGEHRHLSKHADLARQFGVKQAMVPRNGNVIAIDDNGLSVVDEVPSGRLVLDGSQVLDVSDASIADRRRVSQNGMVTVSLVLDDDGHLVSDPALSILGVAAEHPDVFYDKLLDICETALDHLPRKKRTDEHVVMEKVRIAVRRSLRNDTGKNPGVAVMVSYVES